jgi:hypothetical protein
MAIDGVTNIAVPLITVAGHMPREPPDILLPPAQHALDLDEPTQDHLAPLTLIAPLLLQA